MKPGKLPVEDEVDDGTLYRKCHLQLRESGIKEILAALGGNGFCSLGSGRLIIQDGEVLLQFCANVGTYDTRVLALGMQVIVPLTAEEESFHPPDPEPEPEEKPDEIPPAVAAPDPTQLP